jgi:glycosyltransferase involved in cell wall biosynthesis
MRSARDLDPTPPNEGASPAALELSIVMPCLNEAETLAICIRKARAFLEASGIAGEIVIGDNGSTDGSQEIARREGARVVDVPVRGYGAALYHASVAARGRYVIMGDSDDSYDFGALAPFVEELRAGHDLVMGNRFRGGIRPGAMPWKNRYLGNPVLTGIGRLFFRCPARDFHCGLRGYSADAFRRLDLRTTGMEFASEMVIKATLLRMRIAEVPTTLDPDGRSRAPHLRPWRDGWRHLRFMLLYSPRWLFLYPGLALMSIGLGVGAWVTGAQRIVAGVHLDVHTLLFASLALLVGHQLVLFALFTRIFAASEGLVPADERLARLFDYFNLERGLAAALAVVLTGAALLGSAVLEWRSAGFGPLEVGHTMRLVIPGATLSALGVQSLFGSFFFSILGLKRR